ncbi:restriction endonuclease [Saccharopolyspora rosea]|uniref:Restriction endonuclease n=1 Tax=Saccharopolyspora rosea TaxID=524884 RepID=A0ABW3FVE9_9PSEU|nr:restriction endonuclease [Saccharopolyspora rosea]
MLSAVAAIHPAAPDGKLKNLAAQLWALRGRMDVGDLVVMPLKSGPQIAIGRITGEYTYREEEADLERRHVRPVQWLIDDVPRTAIGQDLLHSLGAFTTICEVSRNDAAWRLDRIRTTKRDPGARPPARQAPTSQNGEGTGDADTEPIDIERYARDQIASRVIEVFSGHRLAELVAAVLTAEGFTCEVSPKGPDQGIDIVAGRGLLGLDPPRLLVQVKSEATAVGDPVVQQLEGVVSRQGADQGLLVAWGGITREARQMVNTRRFAVKVWNSEDVLTGVFRNYSRLPAAIREELPLKQVWTLVAEPG